MTELHILCPSALYGIINQVHQKMQQEKSEGLVLIPKWPTQAWWPMAMRMLIQVPLILPKEKTTLFLPSNPKEVHPLQNSLVLVLRHLSGNAYRAEIFLQVLTEIIETSWRAGTRKQYTVYTYNGGDYAAVKGILIPFSHLQRQGSIF